MEFDFAERNKKIKSRNQRIRQKQIAHTLPADSLRPAKVKSINDSIFLTGGIGDVIALECYIPQSTKNNIETIYYATQKSNSIMSIFKSLSQHYPKLKNHVVMWDDFSKFWCFFNKNECIVHLKSNYKQVSANFIDADDWSIMVKFPRINDFKYNNSSLLNSKLCGIAEFDLPENYFVICPYSSDKRLANRDFSENDWKNTLNILNKEGVKGVVLNLGKDITWDRDEIIDLSNQTSIIESVEILKNAKGYIGVNSMLSVLSAKLFDKNLYVKNTDEHCFRYKHIYYAPKTNFSFLKGKISEN